MPNKAGDGNHVKVNERYQHDLKDLWRAFPRRAFGAPWWLVVTLAVAGSALVSAVAPNFVIATATLGILAASLLYAYFAMAQWKITAAQLALQRTALLVTERPRLHVLTATLAGHYFVVKVSNVGKADAVKTVLGLRVGIGRDGKDLISADTRAARVGNPDMVWDVIVPAGDESAAMFKLEGWEPIPDDAVCAVCEAFYWSELDPDGQPYRATGGFGGIVSGGDLQQLERVPESMFPTQRDAGGQQTKGQHDGSCAVQDAPPDAPSAPPPGN